VNFTSISMSVCSACPALHACAQKTGSPMQAPK